ncbi:condensation domain-containing protein, partial [Paraburkholderia sp. J63]|uniref:condensation domain-containing protein n=1 Tax=Paraburkholderia sp. J63 TaxID=2805434 RepID=UPI002ABE7D94
IVKFRAAWEAATAQHTILRTGFVQQGEGWLQWVAREAPLPFMLHDWSDRNDHTEALDAFAAHDLAQGFDLARPPLQRVTLVRTAARRHHLIWTHHHVLMDGWSVSQLMGDVLRHYDGRAPMAAGGRYRDYIDWLARRDAGASETWWRGVLAELDEPTRLATALGNADPQPGHGEHLLALDEASTTRLV